MKKATKPIKAPARKFLSTAQLNLRMAKLKQAADKLATGKRQNLVRCERCHIDQKAGCLEVFKTGGTICDACPGLDRCEQTKCSFFGGSLHCSLPLLCIAKCFCFALSQFTQRKRLLAFRRRCVRAAMLTSLYVPHTV
jgi:hypothetical protein